MCIGNRAQVSSHYINGQLRALFENAQYCTEKHLKGLKPASSAVEYATCLAEFYGPGRHIGQHPSRLDLAFFVKFDCPHIEYVCDHEVVLFLNLVEGHYNPDLNKTAQKKALHEAIDRCTLAFRIPFNSHVIDNFQCKAIGNAEKYTSILHVLEMESAVFVPEHSSFPGEHNIHTTERKLAALAHYLTKSYLPLVKRAGHHVLYSLPDFDNLTSTTAYIDYSVISTRSLATDTLFGVHVEDVNTFLRGLWLEAAAFVDDRGLATDAVSKTFLAELLLKPLDAVDDIYMHLYFRPLYVRPLCKREVILYLDIQDIHVSYGTFNGVPKEHLTDWKIAFIVDIVFEEMDEGSSRRIKLDLSTARFCEHLSVFGEHHDIKVLTSIKAALIRQVNTYYLGVLNVSGATVIYFRGPTVHGCSSDTGSDEDDQDGLVDVLGCPCVDEGTCGHTSGVRWGVIQKRMLTETRIGEFDLVTALTQGSINVHFKTLWEAASHRLALVSNTKDASTWENSELQLETCLADFSFVHPEHGNEVFFAGSFSAPKVQLICNKGSTRAVFYLYITEGHLKTLGPGKNLQPSSQAHKFSHWRLAFEVDLKIIDSNEDTASSIILRRLGLDKPTGLKQLVLSLSSAKLNLSLSTVPGLFEGTDYRTIRARREALVYYIQTCYFSLLKRAHHDVLYTIPQSAPGAHHQLLTTLQFEIVPFSYASGVRHLEGIFGRYRALFERNTIVITGMTGGRPLPRCTLPRGINWVCGFGKDIPYGTVYLSRKSFLEGVLLERLKRINRETTIVPFFSGIKNGQWVLKLATWDVHRMKKDVECNWREVTKKNNLESLEFEWKNKELWRYEHDDDLYVNGIYSIDCITNNVLIIPTSRTEKSIIQLKGAVKMHLKYEGGNKDWSAETTIHWSANIVFGSTSAGLRVELHPSHVSPDFRPTNTTLNGQGHETHTRALHQLRETFPDFIDFSDLLRDLKDDLEGAWAGVQMQAHELCVAHPVFTRHGDLLLELVIRDPHVNNFRGSNSAQRTVNGKRIALSLNDSVAPVEMDGNRNSTGEHWLRNVTHKAEGTLQVYSPSVSRPPSSSKITKSSIVSQETVIHQSSITGLVGEVEDYAVCGGRG